MLSLQLLCHYKLLQHLNIREICQAEALTQIVIHEGSNGKLKGIKKIHLCWLAILLFRNTNYRVLSHY